MDSTDNAESGLSESVALTVSHRFDKVASEFFSMVVQAAVVVDAHLLTELREGGSVIRGCPECPEDLDSDLVPEQLKRRLRCQSIVSLGFD
jgi:hypothetical protein